MSKCEQTSQDEVAHYGVKGMHWGVRKARTGDLNVRASRLERVASGKGTVGDKVVSLGGSSVRNLVKSGGLKNEAARRAADYRAQIDRLANGKAKTSDLLKAYGSASIYSVIGSANKKTDFVPNKG